MNTELLYHLWYLALPGQSLPKGQMRALTILEEPILLGRSQTGKPFALRNICPHRGIPLSYGKFDGCEVECCYHGWRFDTSGICTAIPSLVSAQNFNISRIKVLTYPCVESQGNIWIYIPKPGEYTPPDLPEIPQVPEVGAVGYKLVESKEFACEIDHAAVGLMDPAHGPYVHKQWWWRSRRSMHEKAKKFAPISRGFKMVRHEPSKNSRAYKILGGNISTEITFQLPGVRIEHIKAGKHTICALTTLTPVTREKTLVYQFFYWNAPALNLFKFLIRPAARAFLRQDHDMVIKQQEGLKYNPKLMLINDADRQAKWYYQLKKEFIAAQQEQRDFKNPVTETVLRWSS